MEDKKVILSLKDLEIKFRVRGRILQAIRGVSLDIYENESIAIVGESGSGKSVLTKTFAGMLDSNGFISNGQIILDDEELQKTSVKNSKFARRYISFIKKSLDKFSKLEFGADTYKEIINLKAEKAAKISLSEEESEQIEDKINELKFEATELYNLKQTFDSFKEKDKISETSSKISVLNKEIKALEEQKREIVKQHKQALKEDVEYNNFYNSKMAELKAKYAEEIKQTISEATAKRNEVIAKEVYLSIGRYGYIQRIKLLVMLLIS